MEQKFQRREIADGVFFSRYIDPRFKINRISVVFLDTLDKNRAGLNALIPSILSRSNSDYPTMRALNERLAELYAATLCNYVRKNGDTQIMELYADALDDSYAIGGEKILSQVSKLICGCLFKPVLENGCFPEKTVETQKQNQIDDNDSEINDKALFAFRRGTEITYENEPAAVSGFGENELVREITPKAAYEHYLEMLEKLNIEIICVGSGDFSEAEAVFRSEFSKINRQPFPRPITSRSVQKKEIRDVTEKMDVTQSKLFMSYKSDSRNKNALRVMSALLGGDVSSKLFTVVREKLSLCYYCYSNIFPSKGTLIIESGVENENLDKARAAISEQVSEIQNGNFTDEDLTKIKRSIANDLRSANDRTSVIFNWYLNRILDGEMKALDEHIKCLEAVTREEIIEAAKSLAADSIYIITSNEEAEE